MNKIVIALFLLFVASQASSIINKGCQYVAEGQAVYDLLDFSQTNFPKISYDNDTGNYANMSVCTRQIAPCGVDNPPNAQLVYATVMYNNQCYALTDPAKSPETTLIDSTDPTVGLVLTYPPFVKDGQTFNLIVELSCNKSISDDEVQWFAQYNFTNGINTVRVVGSGAGGCPYLTVSEFNTFMEKYKWIFAVSFFCIGTFVLFFGLKMFNYTIFMIAAFTVSIVSGVIFLELPSANDAAWVKWVVFCTCVVIGLIAGYAAVKFEKAGFFLIGFLLGALGGLFLYNLVLHALGLSESVLYVVTVLMGIICGGMTLWLYKQIIIIATCAIGSYLSIRGVSFILGGFPNEFMVAEGLINFTYTAYIYMAFMGLSCFTGIIVQNKMKKDDEDKQETSNSHYSHLPTKRSPY